MTSSMKPEKLTIPIHDPMFLQEIGRLCVHWSLLEFDVERAVANLRGTPGQLKFEGNLTASLDTLKDLAKASRDLTGKQRTEISLIAGDIKSLSDDRDRAIHGLWGVTAAGETHSVHWWSKKPPLWRKETLQSLRSVRTKVWSLHERLQLIVGEKVPHSFDRQYKQRFSKADMEKMDPPPHPPKGTPRR